MTYRQCDFVKLWGLSPGRISQMCKAGMPLDSIQAAEAWRIANNGRYGGIAKISPSSDGGGAVGELPEPPRAPAAGLLDRADLHGVGARLVEAEVQAWRDLYAERSKKVPDSDRVLALTRVWREAVATRMQAEKQLIEIRVREGVLVAAESARGMIRDALEPIIRRVRDLPRTMAIRCNPNNSDLAARELADWSVQAMRQAQSALAANPAAGRRRQKGGAVAPEPHKGASATPAFVVDSGGAEAPVTPQVATATAGAESGSAT